MDNRLNYEEILELLEEIDSELTEYKLGKYKTTYSNMVPTLVKHCTRAIASSGKHDWDAALNICKDQMSKYGYYKNNKRADRLEPTEKGHKKDRQHATEPDNSKKSKEFVAKARSKLGMK